MTNHITIPRALLEQALNVLTGFEQNYGSLWYSTSEPEQIDSVCSAIRAELAKPTVPTWHDAPETIALKSELERAKDDHHRACGLVADMHAAAVGEMTGPRFGVVEDVAALKAERDATVKDAERYRWLAAHARTTSEHWGGRWSLVIDGPAPKSHNSEDDLDDAIDSAIAKAEGK